MKVEVFFDNLYCFQCRAKMVELVPYKGYQCSCGLRCTDPMIEAQLMAGLRRCLVCSGAACPACHWLGITLDTPEEDGA